MLGGGNSPWKMDGAALVRPWAKGGLEFVHVRIWLESGRKTAGLLDVVPGPVEVASSQMADSCEEIETRLRGLLKKAAT